MNIIWVFILGVIFGSGFTVGAIVFIYSLMEIERIVRRMSL